MSIRFQCASCGQPIEVDAEWAGKLVGCPYCRKTVTAPMESTFTAPPQIPMASRIPDAQPAYAGRSSATMAISRAPVSNMCAMIAFALASFVVLMFVLAVVVTSAHSMELRELESRWSKTTGGFDKRVEEVQKFLTEQQSNGMGWIVAIMLMEIGSMVASLGAVIFGIIGLTRPIKRGFAVAALFIAGCSLLFFCVGLMFNFT